MTYDPHPNGSPEHRGVCPHCGQHNGDCTNGLCDSCESSMSYIEEERINRERLSRLVTAWERNNCCVFCGEYKPCKDWVCFECSQTVHPPIVVDYNELLSYTHK